MSWSDQPRTYEEIKALTVEEAMAEAGIDQNHPCFKCELARRVCTWARNDAQEAWSYDQFAAEEALDPSRASGTDWSAYYERASECKAQSSQDRLARAAELAGRCVKTELADEEVGRVIVQSACHMVVKFGGGNGKRFAYDVVHGPMPPLKES